MKGIYLCGCLVGIATLAHGQGQVTGKILDRQTHQPVPYAGVSVLGSRAGTTSNAEGDFVLTLSALPARLVVTQLSYGRDTVAVVAAGALRPIELVPAAVTLPTVDMGSYTAELLRKAYRVLQRTNATKQYGQAFYRQTTRLDATPTEVQEMVWDVQASSAGLEGTHLAQARYAKRKDALLSYKDLSKLTKTFQLYSSTAADTAQKGRVLSANSAEYYTLRLLGLTQNGGQTLAEIEFVGKPAYNSAHVQGTIVIDTDTYQVLRFRAGMDASSNSNNPTLKFNNGRLNYDVAFRPQPAGAVLDYVKTTYVITVGRLLKADIQEEATGFTYFYGWQPTPSGVAYDAPSTQESDMAAIKRTTYDAVFWRNNPVVKRTPLEEEVIKSFEQQRAFGTLFDK
jgi:hypothetical protein